jgi:glycosyltransferase involved in cell wall biosynthesis
VKISVITPSLPTRADKLAECMDSVKAQTLPALEHLVAVDHDKRGPSAIRNELLAQAKGTWIAVLDDDDLLYPNHLEVLSTAKGDVRYTHCDVGGKDWNPNRDFDADELRQRSYIPATCLIRTSLLRKIGGWREQSKCPSGFEDWDLYLRALDAGATFTCIPEVTWRYRFHGGNRTDRGANAT